MLAVAFAAGVAVPLGAEASQPRRQKRLAGPTDGRYRAIRPMAVRRRPPTTKFIAVRPARPNGGAKADRKKGSLLTLDALMDLLGSADGYVDYIRKLTEGYEVDSGGAFFALHGDETVTPETPQVFMRIGEATIAYAPQMYTEVFWSSGEETIHFQIVEEADKSLVINGHTFATSGKVNRDDEFRMTPAEVRNMHRGDLIRKTNKYAKRGCQRCHVRVRRRMVEADNHGRRFVFDQSWRFRRTADAQRVKRTLGGLFSRFASGPTRKNPLYRWFWEQEDVVKRGGRIRPNDTFAYEAFVRDMLKINGNETLGELRREARWGTYKEAFAAAVQDSPRVDDYMVRTGMNRDELRVRRDEIERYHAETNLEHHRARNQENIAWILAKGKRGEVERHKEGDLLLLNRHSIRTIGPRILDMLVSDRAWQSLGKDERARRVRLRDLDVSGIEELRSVVLAPSVVAKTRRRTNTHIVIQDLLGTRNKNVPLQYLSSNVFALTAETGNEKYDILDVYAQGMLDPLASPFNEREVIDTR